VIRQLAVSPDGRRPGQQQPQARGCGRHVSPQRVLECSQWLSRNRTPASTMCLHIERVGARALVFAVHG
jgi:hypothetical protein